MALNLAESAQNFIGPIAACAAMTKSFCDFVKKIESSFCAIIILSEPLANYK